MDNLTRLTFREMLENSRSKYSHKPALGFINENLINYDDLHKAVRNTACLLSTLGVRRGDRVALLGENSPNWGIAYLSITTMGAVVVPILPDFSEAEVENIIRHSESRVAFVSSKLYNRTSNLKSLLDHQILINNFKVIFDDNFDLENNSNYSYPVFEKPFPENFELPIPEENDLASIIYTSGTTGRPKGVMLTHKNLISNALATLKIQDVNDKDRLISILPLPHTYECTIGFLIPVMRGATVYYLPKPPTAAVLLPAMEIVKPTMILSVPLVIEKIYRSKILPGIQSSALKNKLYKTNFGRKFIHKIAAKKLHKAFGGELHFFGIGGAKLSFEVEQFLYEGKFPYSIGYGMTETSPLLSGCTPRLVKFRHAGFALPGQEMRVHEPDLHTGEGEIYVKGDNNMIGYYKEPELTKDILTEDGWLKTGDLGVMDSNGYVELKGRLKNMILGPSGENIYPEAIEEVINSHELVIESIVYELKGKLVARVHLNYEEIEKKYEHLKHSAKNLQVSFENHVDGLKEEIRAYVNAQVANFSKLNLVVVQPEPFEKTPTQKIKRFLYTNRL